MRPDTGGGTPIATYVAPVGLLVLAALGIAIQLALAEPERPPGAHDARVELAERVEPGHGDPSFRSRERVEPDSRSRCGIHAASPSAPTTEVSIVLRVSTGGAICVGGKPFRDDQLDNLFRAVFAHDKSTQVVLEFDQNVAHRRVVDLMERVKAAGLTKLWIGTSGDT